MVLEDLKDMVISYGNKRVIIERIKLNIQFGTYEDRIEAAKKRLKRHEADLVEIQKELGL